jgi:predicted lipoprotein with Yx(FWY)xxD motif
MKTKFRIAGLLAAGAASLAVAACGSSSSGSTTHHAASTTPAASTTSNASAKSVTIKTAKSSHGTYLVGPSGRALYLWVADSKNKSVCSGACAKIWPPLTTTGSPGASGGAMSADLGTITRSDGTKQVTYKGHPLYYYAADTGPGTTTGEGSNSYGAKWWLVSPAGAALTTSSSSGSSSSSSSGGSSSSSSWG